jgi:hypothetical protein
MKTVRRLYFYAVAFISLEVVLWGLIGLLRSMAGHIILDNAQTLAQAISLILVGVPIFLVHWLWTQRAAAREDEEKTATLRAVFLHLVLMSTLVPVAQNLLAFINRTLITSLQLAAERALIGGSQTWQDNLIAIAMNGLVAIYFWSALRNEWKTLPEKENFSDVRRLYRFLWVLYSLIMVIFGAQQLLTYVFTMPTDVIGGLGREIVVNGTALLLVGAPIWLYTWRLVQDSLADSAEKESNLRLGLLYVLSLSGVVTVLTSAGQLLYFILNRILGESIPWSEFIQNIGRPIAIGIPLAVVWAYYGKWLNQQFDFEENPARRAGRKRLYFYILSALGLAASFAGIASLFAYIIDLAFIPTYLGDYSQLHRLTGSIAAIVVGLPLWLIVWKPMQTEALADNEMGNHARRSVIRKAYLYLALFASVIGGMIAAVTLAFNLINAALGGDASNLLNNTLNALQVLTLFVVLLLYHLSVLRKDGLARVEALEAKQEQFNVLVFDSGGFGEKMKAALQKHAPKLPVTVVNANEKFAGDIKANAIVLPGSLVVNTPAPLEGWLRGYNGNRLVVPDEAAGVYWVTDATEAAHSLGQLAEGQEIQKVKRSGPTAWTIVMYVFAALFALQLLLMLFGLVVSMATNF